MSNAVKTIFINKSGMLDSTAGIAIIRADHSKRPVYGRGRYAPVKQRSAAKLQHNTEPYEAGRGSARN